jgi:hypothetical protein
MSYELTPEQVERYDGFTIKESPDSVSEHREFFLNKNGWGLSGTIIPGQPQSLTVRIDVEKYDASVEEANQILREAKTAFVRYVEDGYGFWTQDESQRLAEAEQIIAERGGDPED